MSPKYLTGILVITLAVAANAKQSRVERQLVVLKGAIMSADYRGDLAQLGTLRGEAKKLSSNRDLGYLADYWSGYASWRIVLNSWTAKMTPDETKAHLERAVTDFESSIREKTDFADAYAGAAAVHGWLAALNARSNPEAMKREVDIFKRQIDRALALEPNNPRVLWVQSVPFSVLPAERGGDIDRAIELYRSMLKNATPLNPDSPLPDWGRVEALMSLASAHVNQTPPNLDAAKAEVKQVLDLQPDWHYVRDILAEQIQAKEKPLHDFDYLLGDWQFTGTNVKSGAVHGVWSASQLGDGEILDEIRISSENGTTYRTQYLRVYNLRSNQWEIVATEKGGGLQNRGTAVREGGEIRIEQTIGAATGKPSLMRIRYYDIRPDHFSWSADRSNDNGATWVTGYQQLDVNRVGPAKTLTLTSTEGQAQH